MRKTVKPMATPPEPQGEVTIWVNPKHMSREVADAVNQLLDTRDAESEEE